MQTSSEFITLRELVGKLKERTVVIPLMQRNYKWAVHCNNTSETSAEKLLRDIINAKENGKNDYTIGMTTFYVKEGKVEIIDGQQRLITLSLLMKALGKYDEFIQLSFERDEENNKERENYLKGGQNTSGGVDVQHMQATCKLFCDMLEETKSKDTEGLYLWILENVKILCRYTENEPLQEFLNLNEKKTPFSSTDYDRAYQLKYQGEKQKITPAMIIREHNAIEKYLYSNNTIFTLVKKRYPESANRMDLVFEKIKSNMEKLSDYYEKIDALNDDDRDKKYRRCYLYLEYCHRVLRSISQEIEERNKSSLNVNVYNSVMMLYKMDPGFKFFDLLDIDKPFEQNVQEQFNLLAETYGKNPSKNAFMQSQLLDKMDEKEELAVSNYVYKEAEQYLIPENLKLFENKVKQVEQLIEKGKNYSDLIKGGKKSFYDILNISEIKQIIVPTIQRDYTFGSNKEKVEGLFLDISRNYISGSIKGLKDSDFEDDSIPSFVFKSLKKGKIWDKVGVYTDNIKQAPKYKLEACCRPFGIKVEKYVKNGWKPGNPEKETLNNVLKEWSNKLNIFDEQDFEKIKKGKYRINSGEEKFLFSVILGCLEDGNFYLYDGQQRMVTLVYLCAFLINKYYSSLKQNYETPRYINLLRKFKFEGRKEANDLLLRLLDVGKPIDDLDAELVPYIIDHSTFSIVNMIKTYDEYKNGYGKKIMSFDLDYLMKNVVFEFAVVKEASVADQMYMDLNSKNVPLTPYENYKAELVYILSTRFSEKFNSDWKYQLDNNFLNCCYEQGGEWDKTKADKAEQLEIQLIHWCFKMACMEYGISIGEIDDPQKRLCWLEEDHADEVLEIVGGILKKTHLDASESGLFELLKNINLKEKILGPLVQNRANGFNKADEFNKGELNLWFRLRELKNTASNEYKFETMNDSQLKIYNWNIDDVKSKINYWISLAEKKSSNAEQESDMICFLLPKLHCLWQYGYLQVDLLEIVDEFNEEELKEYLDFFSEKYLEEKSEKISSWLEYIYIIKLNEMRDVKKYKLVQIWEEAEKTLLTEQKEIFTSNEKKLAKERAFGDYNLWKKINDKYGRIDSIKPIEITKTEGDNIADDIAEKIQEKDYMASRIRKKILDQSTEVHVTINYKDNQTIKNLVKTYVEGNLGIFAECWKEKYSKKYYSNDNETLYKLQDDNNNWAEVDCVKLGDFEIKKDNLPKLPPEDSYWNKMKQTGNYYNNFILFNWWAYYNKIISADDYKTVVNMIDLYNNVPYTMELLREKLPAEEVKPFWETYEKLSDVLHHREVD